MTKYSPLTKCGEFKIKVVVNAYETGSIAGISIGYVAAGETVLRDEVTLELFESNGRSCRVEYLGKSQLLSVTATASKGFSTLNINFVVPATPVEQIAFGRVTIKKLAGQFDLFSYDPDAPKSNPHGGGLKGFISTSVILVFCSIAAPAEERTVLVPIGGYLSKDKVTAEAVTTALNAAHLKYNLTSSRGTTITVNQEDAVAARVVLRKLLEKKEIHLHLIEANASK